MKKALIMFLCSAAVTSLLLLRFPSQPQGDAVDFVALRRGLFGLALHAPCLLGGQALVDL